jgi:pimeloyl-ACP methyl ester carboxylesterase
LTPTPGINQGRSEFGTASCEGQGYLMSDWFWCTDGTRLRVAEYGDPTAPITVILVHCFALNRHEWDPVLPGLAAACGGRVRMLSYDHRGYGESDPAAAEDATLARLGDDLAELIADRVPTGPVVLAGHSMGAMVLMALAERHAGLVHSRVAGAVFISTACSDLKVLSLGLVGPLATAVRGLERLGVGLLSALRREVITKHPRAIEPFVRWLVFGVGARAADVAAVARMAASCRPATMLIFRSTFDEHDRRDALVAFDGSPAAVLVGDRDRLTQPRHAATIAEWLPSSRLVILAGAGHMLPHERSAEVVDAIGRVSREALAQRDATQPAAAAG